LIASYNFSKNKSQLLIASAQFYFQDGLIIRHTDDFDIWKWSKQALGLTGICSDGPASCKTKFIQTPYLRKYQKPIHDSSNFKTIFKRDLNRLKQEMNYTQMKVKFGRFKRNN
jgi:hypothetical protein